MIKEVYKIINKTITLNIFQNAIESVRNNNITKTACRVYKDGFIGIASTLGDENEDTFKEALCNLDKKIVAGFEPEKDKTREKVTQIEGVDTTNLISIIEKFLNRFNKEYPDFVLSQKISLVNEEEILKNNAGLCYRESKNYLSFQLLVKHKLSEDIYDAVICENIIDKYNEDEIFYRIETLLKNFKNVVDMPKVSKLPIILPDEYMGTVVKDTLNGEFVHKNASLLSNKVGEKVFNDQCSIYFDKSDIVLEKFFDEQGSTLKGDKIDIISKGVFVRPLVDKKLANESGYECTAAAGGSYDSVPKVESKWLRFKHTADSLKELLGDREAILLHITMGGDCTNEGNASLPAQTAYLYKNGEILGRLPRCNISFNLLDMLGKDYIGAVRDNTVSNFFDMIVFEGCIN